ncbi:MAG: hypothetical protein C4526_06200 [Nitrospiraceae bacterium]|nr:MAG: hypothetical protein C4526_06200 [Nitrospiraceae bacterium]
MKVLVLTSYTPHNVYLVNRLTSKKEIVAKVTENRPLLSSNRQKMEVRKKMIQKYGLIRTLNKLFYNKYKTVYVNSRSADTVKNLLFPGSREIKYTLDVPSIETANINDKKCIDFVSAYNPDIIAVCGTGVIKPEVFRLSRYGTINIHCGITPEYRSADPILWALYNNEPDKVGVTVHFVDEGIDTGDIIYQKAVGVTKDDNLDALYCKCIKTGAELMIKAIDDIERGEVKTFRKDAVPGRAYYHMDLGIWQYMNFLRRFKRLKKSL